MADFNLDAGDQDELDDLDLEGDDLSLDEDEDDENSRFLVREDSEIDGVPQYRPMAWNLDDEDEADDLVDTLTERNRRDPHADPATYTKVKYDVSDRFSSNDDFDDDLEEDEDDDFEDGKGSLNPLSSPAISFLRDDDDFDDLDDI